MCHESRSFSANDLLIQLEKLDVRITIENDRLSCSAPKGVLTQEIQQELRSKKSEILEILRQRVNESRIQERVVLATDCLQDLFARQVESTPEAIAVVAGACRLTYHELDIRSNRLAHLLRSIGVGPDVLAGVCMERSAGMVVALLAVLKAGGAYVPLDPQFPRDRLRFMLEDSQAAVLLIDQDLPDLAPPDRTVIVCLERDRNLIAQESPERPTVKANPKDLAYVIYTSGSTGRPKGVAVEHRSLVNLLTSMLARPGISERDRLLAVTTLSFDIAGLEIFLPLIAGAQLIIAPRSAVADGVTLARLLRESEATMMQATPVTWRLLLDSGWDGLPRLKALCGGEAFPRELANRLVTHCAELWNLYGPTETTIWSTLYRVEAGAGPMPIGQPIANTTVYVLDEERRKAPPGAVGELYIGGLGVAREYLGLPELTAGRFLADPFQPGARMYRTGDLVRFLPDGNLGFIGRNDQQVKLRGFRIELGEIESALERLPEIRQAVVELREDDPNDQRLVAYLIADRPLEPGALRGALASRLPEHMIPSAFVFLDAFPLTPNNKVDRKALPAPAAAAEAPPDTTAPASLTHTARIAAIWRLLLKVPAVGLHDNFFTLGGHSLLVLQLQSQLRRQMSVEVSIPDLFLYPTVAGLAQLLHQRQETATPTTNGNGHAHSTSTNGFHLPNGNWLPLSNGNGYAHGGTSEPNLNGSGESQTSELASTGNLMNYQLRVLHSDPPEDIETEESLALSNPLDYGLSRPGSPLVAAQTAGSRTPLFLVAGFQGPADTLLVLSRLLPHLSPDQPLYGLRPRWIDGGGLYSCVEEEAREYLAEVRAVQPAGPYLLGGYCLSGLVAFEMARQLMEAGEQIALLALIDTERPTAIRAFAGNTWQRLQRAQHIASVIRNAFHTKDRAKASEARGVIRRQTRLGPNEITSGKAFYRSKVSYQKTMRKYLPQQYPGRITLILNEQLYQADKYRGWDQIPIGELEIKKVSGDHITMFTEHGKEMADLIFQSVDMGILENSWRTDDTEVGAS